MCICIVHGHRQQCGVKAREVGAWRKGQKVGGGWETSVIVSTIKKSV